MKLKKKWVDCKQVDLGGTWPWQPKVKKYKCEKKVFWNLLAQPL